MSALRSAAPSPQARLRGSPDYPFMLCRGWPRLPAERAAVFYQNAELVPR